MVKVLILAYDFPPYVSVGGLRPYSWLKYFHEFDIYPIIVTRQWNNLYKNGLDYVAPGYSDSTVWEENETGTTLRTPYQPNLSNVLLLKYGTERFQFIRKIISAYYEFAQYIFFVGPKSALYHEAKKYMQEHKVDCILATGDPYVLFRYAAALSEEFNVPWIADYRDPWSQDSKVQQNPILKAWNSFLESRILKTVKAVTTVSTFFEKKITALVQNKPFYIISNGFDPDASTAASLVPQSKTTLQIAFVGTILKWHPIEVIFQSISEFILSNPDAKLVVNFYGINMQEELQALIIDKYAPIAHCISIHPKMENADLQKELAKNNVMLLFNYYSYMGTKIYDYIGIRRKIILCFENDPVADDLKKKYYNLEDASLHAPQLQTELINETNSGVVVKDGPHLTSLLGELYTELRHTGTIRCDSRNVENYSRKIQVQHLARLIKDIL